MNVTLSAIKADVGSPGGHTMPSPAMISVAERIVGEQKGKLLLDATVTFTGDDIALIMSHTHGIGAPKVHDLAWSAFVAATKVAKQEGNYAAGQDLLADAPSGNVRGAGPGVAELEFKLDFSRKERPAEAFMVFAMDKCGPGAFNLPLYLAFCDPMHDGGLLLNPKMHLGFSITIIDMNYKGEKGDRVITLEVPERSWDVAALLHNPDRYAIEAIYSRYRPGEQIVAVAATRLHNIAGVYTGKDDPIAIARTQGMFPAPEEMVEPYLIVPYVTGDARGSHVMPLFPTAINTPVTGPYCHPLVTAIGFSMNREGQFAHNMVSFFDDSTWDEARRRSQVKALEMRKQGFVGAAMASQEEIAYTGLVETHTLLSKEFKIRKGNAKKEQ